MSTPRLQKNLSVQELAEFADSHNPMDFERELVEDIQQGMADYEAGLAQPLAEAFAEIRQKLGIREEPDTNGKDHFH